MLGESLKLFGELRVLNMNITSNNTFTMQQSEGTLDKIINNTLILTVGIVGVGGMGWQGGGGV
jgi:hypothetical protein